jgi:hypothetical protein
MKKPKVPENRIQNSKFKIQNLAASIFLLLIPLTIFGQSKYGDAGTRVNIGYNVTSPTPVDANYVYLHLSDTASMPLKYPGVWKFFDDVKQWWGWDGVRWAMAAKPTGRHLSIQTRWQDQLMGSSLGIQNGFIQSLDEVDAGLTSLVLFRKDSSIMEGYSGRSNIRVTPYGGSVSEAYLYHPDGARHLSHVWVDWDNIELYSASSVKEPGVDSRGSTIVLDSATVRHVPTIVSSIFPPPGFDRNFYAFKSSLLDTTFRIWKKLKFEQPATSVYTKNGDLHLTDQTGDYALSDLVNVPESDPVWTAEKVDYYTRTNMQTSGQSQMHWDNITNKPTIPEAQVNADWDATDGVAQILNKPTIPEEYTLPVATASTLGGVKVVSGLMDSGNAGLLTNLPRLGVYKYHPVNGGDISVFPGGGGNFTSGFDWWDNISGFPGDGLYCFKIIHACYSIDYTQWYMKEETVMCMPEGMVARLSVSENANTENHLKISDVQWVDVGINTGMYTLKFEYSGTSSTGITGNWMYRVRVLLLENYSGELQ